jgi:hypothetical protein
MIVDISKIPKDLKDRLNKIIEEDLPETKYEFTLLIMTAFTLGRAYQEWFSKESKKL